MGYIPVTPFRRLVDAAHLERHRQAVAPPPGARVNKWEALRELTAARGHFGLSDRDLAVLQALVSFHPGAELSGQPVVHPANATICERLNGMADSTMRRHLAHLVQTGFVWRRDSPNGKRYVRRNSGAPIVFGLDLTPLVLRFAEICAAAETARAEAEKLERLRETVSLMRRDLAGLAAYGSQVHPALPCWAQMADMAVLTARALRRRLGLEQLAALHAQILAMLDSARALLEPPVAEIPGTSGAGNEQHYQNSQKDSDDSETAVENARESGAPENPRGPNLPLGMVLASCPEIQTYADQPIRHWHDLVRTADVVRPMMGISPDAWALARRRLGAEEAAVVLAAILQRFGEIRSPGGYLRSLALKAANGAFSSGPMVRALARRAA